jgi:hypothetical protein
MIAGGNGRKGERMSRVCVNVFKTEGERELKRELKRGKER